MACIQRGFKDLWGYDLKLLSGPVFKHPKTGFYNVIYNNIREQGANGGTPRKHNYLTQRDLEKLSVPQVYQKRTVLGMLTTLLFEIYFMVGLRTSALDIF